MFRTSPSTYYAMQPDSILYKKAFQFAIRIVQGHQFLNEQKREYTLAKQLLRCGTSIGANIAEANGALTPPDFIAKLSIAYKESLETKFWLCPLKETGFFEQPVFDSMYADVDELAKMLFTSIRSSRKGCVQK
jgi:four helix bundle protein